MTTVAVELPDDLERFVTARMTAKGYANASAAIVDLLEEVRQTEERSVLEKKLQEGLACLDRGEGRPMTAADWERLRANIRTRYGTGEEP